jgi:carbon monoxide dehydrogenase subunit G
MIFEAVIDAPGRPSDVHRFVSDFNNLPRWDPTVISVKQTSPGAARPGTCYRVVLRFLGVRSEMDYRVEEYDPPHRAVLRGVASLAQATDTVVVEPRGSGSRVRWTAEIRFRWPVSLLEPIIRLLFQTSVDAGMRNLGQALGRQTPGRGVRPTPKRRRGTGRSGQASAQV